MGRLLDAVTVQDVRGFVGADEGFEVFTQSHGVYKARERAATSRVPGVAPGVVAEGRCRAL